MQYYEFSVPPGEAALSLLKSIGPLFGGFLVAGLLFSGLRCLLLPAVLFGIGFLLSWLAAINRTIACDQAGFSVTTGLLPWQKATRLHTWSDVRGLRYFEKASANQNAPAVAHFAVDTDSGEAFDQTDAFEGYDFGLLVETFGRMTPHLPYTWAYSQRVKGRPVLENAGMYSKVTRGSAPLGPG